MFLEKEFILYIGTTLSMKSTYVNFQDFFLYLGSP